MPNTSISSSSGAFVVSAWAESNNPIPYQPPTTSARPPRASTARAMSAAKQGQYLFVHFEMIMAKLCSIELFVLALALPPARVVARGQAPQQPVERHLANVRQLTVGGENAEAYFSPDGRRLIYQTNPGAPGTAIRSSR